MSYKQIVKELEKIAKKHGADKLAKAVINIYAPDTIVTFGDPPPKPPPEGCGAGRIWNPILGRCVDDLG